MRRSLLAAIAALAALAAPASAAPARQPDLLWATINVCDTAAAPDTVGVRASMPGNGTRQRLFMRFEAQWLDAARDRFVSSGSSSRWIRVGSARHRSTQGGFSFAFAPPPAGSEFVMRGMVNYEWRGRRNGRSVVVRRATRYTREGISGVEGGDPAGYSAAVCAIRS